MNNWQVRVCRGIGVGLACLGFLISSNKAAAADGATLVSVSIPAGTQVMPRTMFTQTWTIQNTGTTTWTAGQSGYTLNIVGLDTLGAVPLTTNSAYPKYYHPSAVISSGKSVAPGAQAVYKMSFIAPEAQGSYTDSFQINGSSGNFGPTLTVQVTVPRAGSTNQYDRARAVSYANNHVGIMCDDGYFWTDGSTETLYGIGAPVPTNLVGDDCAHFVSCCIGRQTNQWGGGINVITRAPPAYGEPGAQRIIYTNLIAAGYAVEVSSLSQMEPGDVIGWNWEGNSDPGSIDHVTLYLGHGLCAAHANSHLDVSLNYYLSGSPTPAYHLIHILDNPTFTYARLNNNLIFSWTTNWAGYSMYSATSVGSTATWTKLSKSPTKVGRLNYLTNAVPAGNAFYRLQLPGT